jgi:choline-glycine betaine transporter
LGYADAPFYDYDHGGMFPYVVVITAFLVAKALSWLGFANAKPLAKALAIVVGVVYAFTVQLAYGFNPAIEVCVRMMAGLLVGLLFWVFICIGVGASD